MKKETQKQLFSEFTKEQYKVIESKQKDYANDTDVLSNFKTAGANAGLSTEQQILSLIATKVARLGNLFKGKTPNNESIDDSVIDLANYVFLLHCSLNDSWVKEQEFLTLKKMKDNQDEFLGWPLHPSVKERFEHYLKHGDTENFKDNCY